MIHSHKTKWGIELCFSQNIVLSKESLWGKTEVFLFKWGIYFLGPIVLVYFLEYDINVLVTLVDIGPGRFSSSFLQCP